MTQPWAKLHAAIGDALTCATWYDPTDPATLDVRHHLAAAFKITWEQCEAERQKENGSCRAAGPRVGAGSPVVRVGVLPDPGSLFDNPADEPGGIVRSREGTPDDREDYSSPDDDS